MFLSSREEKCLGDKQLKKLIGEPKPALGAFSGMERTDVL
jgi:hypothetical protein